jgi:hypothetical protein
LDKTEKIFIVTQGEYDDYGIVAVFDNRPQADTYCEDFNKSQANMTGLVAVVEEWELNPKFE